MTSTTNKRPPSSQPAPAALAGGPWPTAPWTMEERLRRIEVMGQRLSGFIDFMCKIGALDGTCAAAKEKASAAFYDRLVIVERQLGKIQEELLLG